MLQATYALCVKVLANPFEDIIPRTVPEKKSKKDEKRKKKSEMKATK